VRKAAALAASAAHQHPSYSHSNGNSNRGDRGDIGGGGGGGHSHGYGSPMTAAAATDVLVCARGGGGLLSERLGLAAELWAVGVRAEVVPTVAPSGTEQYEHAAQRGARYMVTLDGALLSAGERVRIKSLAGGAESYVPRQEVVELLRATLSGTPR